MVGLTRAFVALTIDDDTRRRIAVNLTDVAVPGRRVAPGDWHLTLRFLGSIDSVRLDRIINALDETDLANSFDVRWGALGAFPGSRKATVVWLGLAEGEGEVSGLARVVDDAAVKAGAAPEDRPFRPHLTLARVRPPQDVTDVIERHSPVSIKMRCTEVALMASRLAQSPGDRYQPIEVFPLG